MARAKSHDSQSNSESAVARAKAHDSQSNSESAVASEDDEYFIVLGAGKSTKLENGFHSVLIHGSHITVDIAEYVYLGPARSSAEINGRLRKPGYLVRACLEKLFGINGGQVCIRRVECIND